MVVESLGSDAAYNSSSFENPILICESLSISLSLLCALPLLPLLIFRYRYEYTSAQNPQIYLLFTSSGFLTPEKVQ